MKKPLVLAAAIVLLAACSSTSSGGGTSTAPSTSASTSSSATGSSTGTPPTAEQTAWAGQVCTAATDLKTSLQGIASAATAGGDAKSQLVAQVALIKKSADTLATTVEAVPPGSGDDPQVAAVQTSADQLRTSVSALESSVTQAQDASGLNAVKALAGVVSAAGSSISALGATTAAIGTAAKDSKGTLSQAFAANPACSSLTS